MEAKLVVPTFPFLLPSHKLPIRFCYFKHPFFMHFNYYFIPHSHSQGSLCYCFVSLSVPHHTAFLPDTFSLPRSNEETLYVILYFLPDWMHLLRSCRLGGRRKLPSSTFLSSYPVGWPSGACLLSSSLWEHNLNAKLLKHSHELYW